VIEVHEGPVEHVTVGGPEAHGEDAMRARRTQPWGGCND
jgi:hypothetical protein